MKLEKAFFQLIAFGKWQLKEAFENEVTLVRPLHHLFDLEKEQWIRVYPVTIILYRNGTFKLDGKLSLYDREVLEMLKYKQI